MSSQLAVFVDHPALQRGLRVLPMVAVIALILLLASTAARLLWLVVAPRPTELVLPTVVNHSGGNDAASSVGPDFSTRIAAIHVFGKVNKQVVETAKPVDAPETRQNLKLKGIYAGEDEHHGYALIASGSAAEKLYGVGDQLPGRSKLSAVYPDHAILERSGKYETLRLIDSKRTGGRTIRQGRSSRNTLQKTRKHFGPESQVSKLRAQILKNPARLAQLVNAVPARENGRFVGFRIITKQSHPVFDDLNIHSGDIITRVNGIDLDSPQKGFQVLQQLSKSKQVSVTLNRGGQIIELNHSL
ncbi:MAG TPA: type II secretion system protein GspC [Gammaproteobacteria bacterium]|nr:type II secretion system protein GspC [Gammaproteobacteria bacterium]